MCHSEVLQVPIVYVHCNLRVLNVVTQKLLSSGYATASVLAPNLTASPIFPPECSKKWEALLH